MTQTVQFQIKQYGLKGDGSGATGSLPYTLILKIVGNSEASVRNIFMGDFDTIAHAKHAAIALFATISIDATDTYWDTPAATTTAAEVLSTVATVTYLQS